MADTAGNQRRRKAKIRSIRTFLACKAINSTLMVAGVQSVHTNHLATLKTKLDSARNVATTFDNQYASPMLDCYTTTPARGAMLLMSPGIFRAIICTHIALCWPFAATEKKKNVARLDLRKACLSVLKQKVKLLYTKIYIAHANYDPFARVTVCTKLQLRLW